jgi:hypothetical protein
VKANGASGGFWHRLWTRIERAVVGQTGLEAPANPLYPVSGSAAPPLPSGQPDAAYDGAYFGGDRNAYPHDTPLGSIPSMAPTTKQVRPGLVVFINGVCETARGFSGEMQAVANATQTPVVGIYNATNGLMQDAAQTILDRLDKGNNPAVTTCTNLIYNYVKHGRPLRLFGYSQGAGIISRSLSDVSRLLVAKGMTPQQVKDAYRKYVTVETVGGAAAEYPDGPFYVHYVNREDPVQVFSGAYFGATNPPNTLVHPGQGSVNISFSEGPQWKGHDLYRCYLPHYIPLQQVRKMGAAASPAPARKAGGQE